MENLQILLQSVENKSLLVIFPHPDDESFATGALLLKAKSLGFKTTVLTLTHGENGYSNIDKGIKQAKAREEELNEACEVLKVDTLIHLDLKDSHLNEDVNKLNKEVSTIIEIIKPGIVVTYDHGGFTGHPDHIAVSVECLKICKQENIPLLWYIPSNLTQKMVENNAREYQSNPNYILRSFLNFRKSNSFFKHKSQTGVKSFWYNLGTYIFLLFASENYHLVDFTKEYKYKYFPFKFE